VGVGNRLAVTATAPVGHGFLPVAPCGRNDGLRRRLAELPGVLALDWVTDMPGLMQASGARVDNAARQTAVQALAAGLPVVGHRPLPGHGAHGVRELAALGLSDLAATPSELVAPCTASPPPGPPVTGASPTPAPSSGPTSRAACWPSWKTMAEGKAGGGSGPPRRLVRPVCESGGRCRRLRTGR
jgi:hypothetical protein